MNVYLIGYRATGKTTIGKLLAEALGWDWIDSDQRIQKNAGKSIAKIFEDQGEDAFRDLESKAVEEISNLQNHVVSLGGGAILRESNRQIISSSGRVVWLTADVETIAARLTADMTTEQQRPSLTGQGVIDEVRQVLEARLPVYRELAELEIDTVRNDVQRIVKRIADWMKSAMSDNEDCR